MTSSNSRRTAGGQAGVRAGDGGGPLGTPPFLQGLGTAVRPGLEGWARGHGSKGPWAGSAWLPKITAAFHQLPCKRSSSNTERWTQPTSAQPQAGHPSESWWQDFTVEILISMCSPQPPQLHLCALGGKPDSGSQVWGGGGGGEKQRGLNTTLSSFQRLSSGPEDEGRRQALCGVCVEAVRTQGEAP